MHPSDPMHRPLAHVRRRIVRTNGEPTRTEWVVDLGTHLESRVVAVFDGEHAHIDAADLVAEYQRPDADRRSIVNAHAAMMRRNRVSEHEIMGYRAFHGIPRPTYSITYDTVTPESAEDGDVSERGYIVRGSEYPTPEDFHGRAAVLWCEEMGTDEEIEPADLDDWSEATLEITRDPIALAAYAVLRDEGATEPSVYPPRQGDRPSWSQPDGDEDFRTGAVTRRTVHFDGLTDEQHAAIIALAAAKVRR